MLADNSGRHSTASLNDEPSHCSNGVQSHAPKIARDACKPRLLHRRALGSPSTSVPVQLNAFLHGPVRLANPTAYRDALTAKRRAESGITRDERPHPPDGNVGHPRKLGQAERGGARQLGVAKPNGRHGVATGMDCRVNKPPKPEMNSVHKKPRWPIVSHGRVPTRTHTPNTAPRGNVRRRSAGAAPRRGARDPNAHAEAVLSSTMRRDAPWRPRRPSPALREPASARRPRAARIRRAPSRPPPLPKRVEGRRDRYRNYNRRTHILGGEHEGGHATWGEPRTLDVSKTSNESFERLQ